MSLFANTDLLSDFKFWAERPTTDESLTDPQIYRLLTIGQQQVVKDVAPRFPRLLMEAPALMVSTDSGATYHINATDADSNTVQPFGHAEVYAKADGRELWGSTYSLRDGDIVFEGGQVRIPGGQTRTFDTGPYIRYVALPSTIDANTQPSVPMVLRGLIVPRALVLWANRGGGRDPRPYEEMYQSEWAGPRGDGGLLATLTTQYRRSADGASANVQWWRTWTAGTGLGLTAMSS